VQRRHHVGGKQPAAALEGAAGRAVRGRRPEPKSGKASLADAGAAVCCETCNACISRLVWQCVVLSAVRRAVFGERAVQGMQCGQTNVGGLIRAFQRPPLVQARAIVQNARGGMHTRVIRAA